MTRRELVLTSSVIVVAMAMAQSAILLKARAFSGKTISRQTKTERTTLSESVIIRAEGRGNPVFNLSDGRAVITSYDGPEELSQALVSDEARGISLDSGDFDEDGVTDLISGYDFSRGGIITLMGGNNVSLQPNTSEAKERKQRDELSDAPFKGPARVFSVPVNPDFIGVGDFNGDGHLDIVIAARGGDCLHLLLGDGLGQFPSNRMIELGGSVSALIAGEINRRDGLIDVALAIRTSHGPELLVYEGPAGAFSCPPERTTLPAETTSLALGQLDAGPEIDIAVAAGNNLILVHGRDRGLSTVPEPGSEPPPARISTHSFPFLLKAIAVGDFSRSSQSTIAALVNGGAVCLLTPDLPVSHDGELTWQVKRLNFSQSPDADRLLSDGDRLILLNSKRNRVHLVFPGIERTEVNSRTRQGESETFLDMDGEPVAALPMRLNGDALGDLVILRSTQTSPAIVTSSPSAVFMVTNNTDNAAAGSGSLRRAIIDANANPGADNIVFNIPGAAPFTITPASALPPITSPVTIDGTTQPGFVGSPVIQINGVNVPSPANGLDISAGNSTVRALAINRFAGPGINIASSSNVVVSCYLGTNLAGSAAGPGNQSGVFIVSGSNNRIGGTVSADRNLISGNGTAIWMDGSDVTGTTVQGNYIGTNASGTAAVTNNSDGVLLNGAQNNTVGGSIAGARNLISSNTEAGVFLGGSANLVQGNYIGTKADGVSPLLPKQTYGIWVLNSTSNTIGGTTALARNVIGGSDIGLLLSGSGVLVQGNYIGLGSNGSTVVSNGQGISTASFGHTIGGTSGARNVISGNTGNGIFLGFGATNNLVQGNYIGTDASGALARPNATGVAIESSDVDLTTNNTIGGSGAGAGNLISGNTGTGIGISSQDAEAVIPNLIQGNLIGTAANGSSPLGNGNSGVFVNSSGTTVGKSFSAGTLTGAGNTIAFNGFNGITAGIDTVNTFVGNSIFSNRSSAGIGPLPIEIFPVDITTIVPVLDSVTVASGNTTITGHTSVDVGGPYYLVLYSYSECSGATPGGGSNPGGNSQQLNSIPILRNTVNFSITLPGVTPPFGFVNAQAIVNNVPGEYGNCLAPAGGSNPIPAVSSIDPATALTGSAGFSLTVIGSNFVSNSEVRFNGNQRSTSFISATQLTASILASDLSSPGTKPVTVFNPAPGGGLSNAVNFTVTSCSFSLNPTSEAFPAGGGALSVEVIAGAGCNWTAVSNDAWITITSGSAGSGHQSVSYSVGTNTGSARNGTMTIAGNTFTVMQASGCTTFFSSPSMNFTAAGGAGNFGLITQPGCSWIAASSDTTWLGITSGSGTSSGTVSYFVQVNPGPFRSGTISVGDQSFTVTQDANNCMLTCSATVPGTATTGVAVQFTGGATASNCTGSPVFDWDFGDGTPHSSLQSPTHTYSSAGVKSWSLTVTISGASPCSQSGTITVNQPGADTIGLFRPSGNLFFLRNTNTPGFPDITVSFGAPGDLPIVGDWDGNGTATIGLYRPSTSTFFLRNSNTTGFPDITVAFGDGPGGDLPIVGDWNGDGVWTIGVYRPGTSTFYLRNSNTAGFPDLSIPFGAPGDKAIVGDWNGDGTTTIGLFRPSGNVFYLRNSNTIGFPDITVSFGASGDLPLVGDWDGNGTTTIGLFRPSGNFFFLRNSNTFGFPDITVSFGAPGDLPLAGDWNGQ